MKIWKAMLVLTISLENYEEKKYVTQFQCNSDNQDYEANSNFKEWTHSERWVCDQIPMDMIVGRSLSNGYQATQGFDHEPSEIELKEVEAKMRIQLSEYVNMEKEYSINRFNLILQVISDK